MAIRQPARDQRSFGVTIGSVLCVIAGWLMWRARVLRGEIVGSLGLGLLICGLVAPSLLRRPNAWWRRFAGVLGYVNARVLLTIVFGLLLVPLSLLWRLSGKDPLTRRRDRWPGWLPAPSAHRDRTHYLRMY
jgi:hypothetical protein